MFSFPANYFASIYFSISFSLSSLSFSIWRLNCLKSSINWKFFLNELSEAAFVISLHVGHFTTREWTCLFWFTAASGRFKSSLCWLISIESSGLLSSSSDYWLIACGWACTEREMQSRHKEWPQSNTLGYNCMLSDQGLKQIGHISASKQGSYNSSVFPPSADEFYI